MKMQDFSKGRASEVTSAGAGAGGCLLENAASFQQRLEAESSVLSTKKLCHALFSGVMCRRNS